MAILIKKIRKIKEIVDILISEIQIFLNIIKKLGI